MNGASDSIFTSAVASYFNTCKCQIIALAATAKTIPIGNAHIHHWQNTRHKKAGVMSPSSDWETDVRDLVSCWPARAGEIRAGSPGALADTFSELEFEFMTALAYSLSSDFRAAYFDNSYASSIRYHSAVEDLRWLVDVFHLRKQLVEKNQHQPKDDRRQRDHDETCYVVAELLPRFA
jgi:hypothetical protein